LSGTGIQQKNATKDINDAKVIRDNKIIRDKPRGMVEQIRTVIHGPGPVLLREVAEPLAPREEATGRSFIEPEERPAVGQQPLEEPDEPTH
jgi:hypothetical protein